MGRARLRDLGITVGQLPPGPLNAITDVAGVRVGHATIIHDAPSVARSGVTTPMPTVRCFQMRLSVSSVSYSST